MSDVPKPKPKHIVLLEEKLALVQSQRVFETRVEEQMRLDVLIKDTQEQLAKAHQNPFFPAYSAVGRLFVVGIVSVGVAMGSYSSRTQG